MLEFWIDRTASRQAWSRDGACWRAGACWVRPWRHPLLDEQLWTDGARVVVAVWERDTTASTVSVDLRIPNVPLLVAAQSLQQRVQAVLEWPLEFALLDMRSGGEVRLTAGEWGTAPIYVAETDGVLRGSWSMPDLSAAMSLDRLDPVALTRSLTLRDRYSCRTVFDDVVQLTERSTAIWDDHGLHVRYPEAALHARPRSVRADVDIVDVYERRLDVAISRRALSPPHTAIELSGGMDSSSVAVTLGDRYPGVLSSYALAYDGEPGAQQLRRRRELIDFAGFRNDLVVSADDHLPFDPQGRRGRGDVVSPHDEPYDEAFGQLIRQAADAGVHTVFTGDGGDELVGLHSREWAALGKIPGRYSPSYGLPPWLGVRAVEVLDSLDSALAPAARVHESTLLGFACRSPLFLRAGVWPLSPLADPQLIRFGEQLPLRWRDNKRIVRERLARRGFSREFVHPPLRENFAPLMPLALRRYGVALLEHEHLANSVLVDYGFVDPDQLRAAGERIRQGTDAPTDPLLYQALALELGLKAMTQRGATAHDGTYSSPASH